MAHRQASFFILLLVLSGCSAHHFTEPSVSQQARIWIDQSPALEVLEARSGDKELFVKFRAFAKDSEEFNIFDARAVWDSQREPEVDLSANIVVPLKIVEEGHWPEESALKEVVSLSEDHWRAFRYELAHDITPKESGAGVVIRTDEDELILYYDKEEQVQAVDIKERPADIRIKETFSQEDLSARILTVMAGYLAEQNIEARRVLLHVDNEDDYTSPFFYVDLDEHIAISLKLPTDREDHYRQGLIKKGMKSADYLFMDSYVFGLVRRPVSSTLRLFSWTQGLSRDLIRPPALSIADGKALPPLYEGEGMDLSAFGKKLEEHIGHKSTSGNFRFLIDGDQFFPRLIDAILAAEESIDVRIFIFDNDDYALAIANLLKKRSNEGIKVRVLLDGMGQVMGEAKVPERLPPGFRPPDSMEQYLRKESKIEVRVRPNAWFKADHTKTIIIDGNIFFTGGMNIGREYRYDWHDLMMAVQGPVVDEIRQEFEIAWAHAGAWGDLGYLKSFLHHAKKAAGEGTPLTTLYTRLNDPQIYKAQLLAIKEARKYIYVHNPYFSDDAIIFELIKARRRGVDVRVILPFNGNHSVMNASNVVTANTLFRHGIRVYFFPRMSHIKAAIYDGWLCTGSANFDKLSLVDNLELNLASADPATVKDLRERLFDADFKRSVEMTEPLSAGWREQLAEFVAEHL